MSLSKIPLETLLTILSMLNRRERLKFSRTCKEYYQIYRERYIRLDPARYIFYREYASGYIKKYDFQDIEFKNMNALVVFEVDGKIKRRKLKYYKNGMCCNGPMGSGIVYPVKRDKIEDIFKNICEKCEMLKNLQRCPVLNGNCGIPTCQHRVSRTSIPIHNITAFRYIHYHELCRGCFDGISKSKSLTFVNRGSYPEKECRLIKFIN